MNWLSVLIKILDKAFRSIFKFKFKMFGKKKSLTSALDISRLFKDNKLTDKQKKDISQTVLKELKVEGPGKIRTIGKGESQYSRPNDKAFNNMMMAKHTDSSLTDREISTFMNYFEELVKKSVKGKLTKKEQKHMELLGNIVLPDRQVLEWKVENSSWLIRIKYVPNIKVCFIEMKNGKMMYPFYNVPKVRVIDLLFFKGKYMWDQFGRRYSLNPRYWVRTKGK